MKLTMTHKESITSLSQLSHHLDLEEEHQSFQTDTTAYMLNLVSTEHLG